MKTVALSEVAQINPKWALEAKPDDAVSFVGMANLSGELGRVVAEEARQVSDVRTGYTPFEQDDLLVAKITPCFENGKIGQATISEAYGAGSTEFHVVRPGIELDSRYALHFLRRPHFRVAGELRMTGSGGQRRVPADFVAGTRIPLPALVEQRRIAGILDKADALRGKRRKAIAHLDVLGQSIFHDMFAGLSGDVLTLRDASLRFVSGRNMVGTGVNAHPTKKVLKVNAASSGEFDGSQVKPLPMNYDPPAAHRVEVGDLIVTRASGTKDLIGVATLVDSVPSETYLPDKLWKAVVNPRLLLAEYFRFLTRSTTYRKYVSNAASGAAGVSNISQAKLLDFQLVLPPIESQQAFADRMAAIESLKMTYRAQLADLDALFLSLQDRAFKGEL